jgi:hypothetical protein
MTETKIIRRITGRYYYGREQGRFFRVYTLNLTSDAEQLLREGVYTYVSEAAGSGWFFEIIEDCTYKRKVNPKNFNKLERNIEYQRGQQL